jgi:hypothetical protein
LICWALSLRSFREHTHQIPRMPQRKTTPKIRTPQTAA